MSRSSSPHDNGPFVVLAPFIGPLLDRFRHGRRWAIGGTLALRAFLSWVLAGLVTSGSAWLLPVALVCLLAAPRMSSPAPPRPAGPARRALAGRASSRQSIAALIGMAVGSLLAAPVGRIGEWSLRVAFLLYVVATIQGDPPSGPGRLRTTDDRDRHTEPGRRLAVLRPRTPTAPHRGGPSDAGRLHRLAAARGFPHGLRRLPPARAAARGMSRRPLPRAGRHRGRHRQCRRQLPRQPARRALPSRVAIIALLISTAVAAVTTLFYGAATLIALGLVTGAFGQLARLCLDALVQRDTDEHVRARVFSGLETRLQLAWVIGAGAASRCR